MAEEELHWGVEVRVQHDKQDDEQVPQHCDHVHDQKQSRTHAFVFWPEGESQKDELGCDTQIIFSDSSHFFSFLKMKIIYKY